MKKAYQLFCGLVATVLLGALPAHAQNNDPYAGKWYRLKTQFRGATECLEGNEQSSKTHNGAAFMDKCQNVTGQMWRFERQSNGFYRLKTKFQGDDRCLEGNANGSVKGGAAFMDKCQDVSGQYWKIEPAGGAYVRLLTMTGAESLEGNQAASNVHGGAAFMDKRQNVSGQLWLLEEVAGAATPPAGTPNIEAYGRKQLQTWGTHGKANDNFCIGMSPDGKEKIVDITKPATGKPQVLEIQYDPAQKSAAVFDVEANKYLTAEANGTISLTDTKKPGSYWAVASALQQGNGEGWFSLESKLLPDHYLRHTGYVLFAHKVGSPMPSPGTFKGDATWKFVSK